MVQNCCICTNGDGWGTLRTGNVKLKTIGEKGFGAVEDGLILARSLLSFPVVLDIFFFLNASVLFSTFFLSSSDYLAMWFATFTWRRICNSYMFISIFYFDTCLLNKFFRIINIAAIEVSQSIEVNESCISALKLYWILFFLRFPCYFTFTLEFCQFSTYRYSCPLDKMYLL